MEDAHEDAISLCGYFGHVKCRQGQKALELFSTNVAKLCYFCDGAECTRHALEEGRCAHKQIIESGWDSYAFLGNSLVDMYPKCGSV